MENNFYNDNFEQMLKDATENFRMYPSRRVWHSIYNDLHPGRRWPSLAVCLLLISSVLYMGVSNNNSINSISRRTGVNTLNQTNIANTPENIMQERIAANTSPGNKKYNISNSKILPVQSPNPNSSSSFVVNGIPG